MISIIRKFLVSGIMVDDEYKESVIGTPQGGNLSPLLANIRLRRFGIPRKGRRVSRRTFAQKNRRTGFPIRRQLSFAE